MERSVVFSYAERDRKLAASGCGVFSESRIARRNQSRSIRGEEGGTQISGAFEVRKDSNDLDEVALSRGFIVGACHNGRELDVEADLEEPDADTNDPLIGHWVDWSRIGGKIKQVYGDCCIGRESVRKVARALTMEWYMDAVRAPVMGL